MRKHLFILLVLISLFIVFLVLGDRADKQCITEKSVQQCSADESPDTLSILYTFALLPIAGGMVFEGICVANVARKKR